MLHFLKHKTQAVQAIKNYVAYLEAHGHHLNAFHCDEGCEFITTDLKKWLEEKGRELQVTAPYSLLQKQNASTAHLSN
jgi:hypothetical protein